MDRFPEWARTDAALAKTTRQLTGAGDTHAAHPAGALRPRRGGEERDTRCVLQGLRVAPGDAAFGRNEFVEPLELGTADRRLKVRHPRIESDDYRAKRG